MCFYKIIEDCNVRMVLLIVKIENIYLVMCCYFILYFLDILELCDFYLIEKINVFFEIFLFWFFVYVFKFS